MANEKKPEKIIQKWQNYDKAHEARDLDLGAAGRGVWLVKVPKYLSEKWKNSKGNGEVGELNITRSKLPGQKPSVKFKANPAVIEPKPGESVIPEEYEFRLTGVGDQNLVILSQHPVMTDPVPGVEPEIVSEHLSIEGKVMQRAECCPVANMRYSKFKKTQIESQNKPQRQVMHTDVVINYKPKTDHFFNIEHKQKKKNEGKKTRAPVDLVKDMLFNAFEKHQYYNIRDLEKLTQQPIAYLKDILKEICIYNMKAPHKNMWELKPENRHYKEDA
ncbi:hypothetical protein ScPMuIL_018303 [Solemya velum]